MKSEKAAAGPSGLQVYLRILGYLTKYWRVFIVSVLGLWVFSSVQIAFIDLLGYMINVLTVVTGDGDIPADINMMTMDAGLTSKVAEWLMADGPVLEQSRLVLPTMMMGLAVVEGWPF